LIEAPWCGDRDCFECTQARALRAHVSKMGRRALLMTLDE
jgi:hypothetical protein